MLVPDSESGKEFAGLVKRAVPTALTVPVGGAATDLMFCREHGCLRTGRAREATLGLCLPAYYQSLASPHTAPHARFDVTEWMPLSRVNHFVNPLNGRAGHGPARIAYQVPPNARPGLGGGSG